MKFYKSKYNTYYSDKSTCPRCGRFYRFYYQESLVRNLLNGLKSNGCRKVSYERKRYHRRIKKYQIELCIDCFYKVGRKLTNVYTMQGY